MRRVTLQLLVVGICASSLQGSLVFAGADQAGAMAAYPVEVSPEALLRLATHMPLPQYPEAALPQKATGTVVASVLVAATGQMERVVVLESPHPVIADVAQKALMSWTFKPIRLKHAAGPSKIQGRVILYFSGESGSGTVRLPSTPDNETSERGGPGPLKEIKRGELQSALKDGAVLLDVRERKQRTSDLKVGGVPVSIPLSELSTRGRTELPPSKLVIVDCSSVTGAQCDGAVHVLVDLGFGRIGVLRELR